jgi:hypothetical protein
MKFNAFVLGLGMIFSTVAATAATSPTEIYLSARDKAITTAASSKFNDRQAQVLLDGLQDQVRALAGPLEIEGFPKQGNNHLTTLTPEIGFGALDGLAATSLDGKTDLLLTTKPLLQAWLTEHSHWQASASDNPPIDIASAFGNENFYTQAISDDAAVYKFADLPVTVHVSNTLARAILFEYGQDEVAPNPPDMLAVSIIQGDRVFIFTQAANVEQIAACKAAFERNQAADHVYEQCFEKQLPAQDGYAELIRQAQALVDRAMSKQAQP